MATSDDEARASTDNFFNSISSEELDASGGVAPQPRGPPQPRGGPWARTMAERRLHAAATSARGARRRAAAADPFGLNAACERTRWEHAGELNAVHEARAEAYRMRGYSAYESRRRRG